MRITAAEYEQQAFVTVQTFINDFNDIKAAGLTPAKFDMQTAIDAVFPDKWKDENTEGRGWTKHNEKKIRCFVRNEITRRIVYGPNGS